MKIQATTPAEADLLWRRREALRYILGPAVELECLEPDGSIMPTTAEALERLRIAFCRMDLIHSSKYGE
jgi:hypothetical protein